MSVWRVAGFLLVAASAAAQGLDSRDRGTADPLLRDMVVAQGTTGTLQVVLPAGTYDVQVTMGDTSFAQNNMMLYVQGALVNGDIDTAQGSFYQPSVPVTLSATAPATTAPLTVAFSNNSTNYWVVNALTVSQGGTQVRRYDFGSGSSPVAAGYTQVLPDSAFDAEVGFGWVFTVASPLLVVKTPEASAAGFPTQADYMTALERFPLYAERGWHPSTTAGQPGYFGDADHGELSMRSMGNYIFTYALLATDPAYDPAVTGVAQSQLLARARECLEHMCRAHVTGDLTRPNGQKWGNHWQSAWWTTRMVAGAKLMWPQLSSTERARVETVVVHEANRHLTRTAPSGSSSDTKSEENAWDAEVLAWATSMFPTHANAAAWQQKANEFCMNTLSTAEDEANLTVVDGQTIKDWVYTRNIHSDYTIENHGSYHFCYMACPLHSFAWAYYGYVANGKTPPQSLFHHARDVYAVIKKTWLSDGRFAYLAGKDWPRYAYGLYFIVPALTMFQDVDDDATARLFERERFRLFEWESRHSGDGSFFSRRFTGNTMTGRLLEYETDCAANLGLSYLIHKRKAAPAATDAQAFETGAAQSFTSANIKAALTRDEKWFASWSWRSLSGKASLGLMVPRGGGDMAESYENNLLSPFTIKNVSSANTSRTLVWSNQAALGSVPGIGAIGQLNYGSSSTSPVQVERRLAFIALTRLHQAVVVDELWARGTSSVVLSQLSGTRLAVANDIFNGNSRAVTVGGEAFNVRGAGGAAAARNLETTWASVDNKLGILRIFPTGPKPASVLGFVDSTSRQASYGSLCHEFLDWDPVATDQTFAPAALIRRTATAFGAASTSETSTVAGLSDLALLPTGNSNLTVAVIPGTAGTSYVIGANFGMSPTSFSYAVPQDSILNVSALSFSLQGRSVFAAEVPSDVVQPDVMQPAAVGDWQAY